MAPSPPCEKLFPFPAWFGGFGNFSRPCNGPLGWIVPIHLAGNIVLLWGSYYGIHVRNLVLPMAPSTSSISMPRSASGHYSASFYAALVGACIWLMFPFSTQAQPSTDEPGMTHRDNPGPAINSISIEILPLVAPDGQTLYFDRKHSPENIGGQNDDDDIYMAAMQPDGTWGKAVNVGPPLNSPGSDVLFWISADGNAALMHSGKIIKQTVGKGKKAKTTDHPVGLAITRRVNGAWTEPTPVAIQGLASLGDSYYATISPDGRKLIIAYNPGHEDPEDLDLFICTAISSDMTRWTQPIPLGGTINTTMFEGAPFMAADNRTLYFASAGHDGFGESDLLMTRRIGNSWNAWTTPVNLGPTINTPMFEASLSVPAAGDSIYISGSGFPGEFNFGRSDIYRLQLPQELRPFPATLVKGSLVAAGKPVEGLIRVERNSDKLEIFSTTSDHNGRFTLILPPDADLSVIGWASGHAEASLPIRTSTQPISGITLDLAGGATPESSSTSSKPLNASADPVIYFPTGSAMITTEAEQILKALAQQFIGQKPHGITVIGFTDDEGEEPMNDSLSLRRAIAVKDWLQGHGLGEISIQTIGKGEREPKAKNPTAAGRALNRRAEIVAHGRR